MTGRKARGLVNLLSQYRYRFQENFSVKIQPTFSKTMNDNVYGSSVKVGDIKSESIMNAVIVIPEFKGSK